MSEFYYNAQNFSHNIKYKYVVFQLAFQSLLSRPQDNKITSD
jgi:hypothetical protein